MTPLWDWALAAYAAPGARDALLGLQDNRGQCICLLLWAAWRAGGGDAPAPNALTDAVALARRWEHDVTGPLRAARRGLKGPLAGVSDEGREAIRTRIKADELDAERLLIEALEKMAPGCPAPGSNRLPLAPALAAAAAAWGPAPPKAELDALARIFEGLDIC